MPRLNLEKILTTKTGKIDQRQTPKSIVTRLNNSNAKLYKPKPKPKRKRKPKRKSTSKSKKQQKNNKIIIIN